MRAGLVALVLLMSGLIGWTDAPAVICAFAGLAGAVGLSVGFARTGPPGVTPLPAVALAGAAGLASAAILTDVIAVSLPWVPLLAPLAVLALLGVVVAVLAGAA